MEFYGGYTPEQRFALPSSSFIDMKLCTDPQGRQANTLEQCVSIATFPQALFLLPWSAPMIGHLYFALTGLICYSADQLAKKLYIVLSVLYNQWNTL